MKDRTKKRRIKYFGKKAYGVICLFLVISLIFTSCASFKNFIPGLVEDIGEGSGEAEKPHKNAGVFKLPISSLDSLDPYNVKSRINSDLLSLCYSGLVTLDAHWNAKNELATFEHKGNSFIFKISDDAYFSDGSKVTADDCIYSYGLAKKGSSYKEYFEDIVSYTKTDSKTFKVTFNKAGTQYANLCTVPIIKKGSDKASEYPIGAGKYSITKPKKDIVLVANTFNPHMKNATLKTIQTVSYDNSGHMISDFNYGGTDAIYADLSGGVSRYRGSIELNGFTSNSLVLAVVNKNRSFFSSYQNVCKGITLGIDRQKLYSDVLRGCAVMTWSPYNPSWSVVEQTELKENIFDPKAAEDYFYKARFYKNEEWKYEYYGDPVNLKIVVSSDQRIKIELAEAVADQLIEYGFSAKVVPLSWEDYKLAVENKSYDILIAEVYMGAEMDLNDIFDAIGYVPGDTALAVAIDNFADGKSDLRSVLEEFGEEMPFVPLYYSRSALAINLNVDGVVSPSENFLFSNIENWTKK